MWSKGTIARKIELRTTWRPEERKQFDFNCWDSGKGLLTYSGRPTPNAKVVEHETPAEP